MFETELDTFLVNYQITNISDFVGQHSTKTAMYFLTGHDGNIIKLYLQTVILITFGLQATLTPLPELQSLISLYIIN